MTTAVSQVVLAGDSPGATRHSTVNAAIDASSDPARVLIGESAAMRELRALLAQVAPTAASVLLLGESGTGKELAARCLHQLSPRAQQPFVPVNCGGLPSELVESELFGHERGAFTGALTARAGRVELAHGGTLFLDEVAEAPLPLQVKLLRVLETHRLERLGAVRSVAADFRLVAATHADLARRVADGSFREDFLYRLGVFPIRLPPLRARREDIPLLARCFAGRLEASLGRDIRLTPAALHELARREWPGNVRELSNVVERLAILHGDAPIGSREVRDLPDLGVARPASRPPTACAQPPGRATLDDRIAALEREAIRDALEASNGVVSQAARLLGIKRTTLAERMRRLGLRVLPGPGSSGLAQAGAQA